MSIDILNNYELYKYFYIKIIMLHYLNQSKYIVLIILIIQPIIIIAQDPSFLFQEDCNQDSKCVRGILDYSEWRFINTEGALWDREPCDEKNQEHYIFLFDSSGMISVYSVETQNCQEITRKIIESYSYKIIKKKHKQYYLRIFNIDRYMGDKKRKNIHQYEIKEYEDYQFLYNNEEYSLVLRCNANNYNEKSVSSYFKPYNNKE